MHSHIRGYLLATAGLMLLWIFIRTLKHGPFDFIDAAARWLWYAYYIPMILIPLLSFFAALCLGKPENWRLVNEALHKAGRTDLIGFGEKCLIRPYPPKEKDERGRGKADGSPRGKRRTSRR